MLFKTLIQLRNSVFRFNFSLGVVLVRPISLDKYLNYFETNLYHIKSPLD